MKTERTQPQICYAISSKPPSQRNADFLLNPVFKESLSVQTKQKGGCP